MAGAVIHVAEETSPETNEQFESQAPRGSHHGMNACSPPNWITFPGRGRAQPSLRRTLTSNPGPSANEIIRNSAARVEINVGRRDENIFFASATTAGTIAAVMTSGPS